MLALALWSGHGPQVWPWPSGPLEALRSAGLAMALWSSHGPQVCQWPSGLSVALGSVTGPLLC